MAAGSGGVEARSLPWSTRLAALVALLSPLAMVAIAATALSGHVLDALLAVALLLLASGAIWITLTRRGGARVTGGVVALAATAGLIVVLALHWRGTLVLAALLLLLALFGLCARYALARDLEKRKGSNPAAVPVGKAEAAALIMNLRSGGGKAERFNLAEEARRRGVEPIVLHPGDDLLELAEGAVDRGAEVIGMAGGDGSQALVATVAARRGVAHVCVPAGTRNHFALDLGLDRDDVVGALDAFTDGLERRVDLARVNDRVFVNNASLGVYAKVVQSDAYRDAKLETWTRMLPELLGPDAEPIDLEFTAPDGTSYDDAPLVLVSNNPYQLTHMAGAGMRAADRYRDARDRRGPGAQRGGRLETRGAAAGGSARALSRAAHVLATGVRGPRERTGRGRPRRRGAGARSAASLRLAAGRAARACATQRRPRTRRARGLADGREPG